MKSIRSLLRGNIRALREKRKMTQEELAAAAGIDYKYLQRIEGRNPPNIKIETLAKIAKALKSKPSDLLRG